MRGHSFDTAPVAMKTLRLLSLLALALFAPIAVRATDYSVTATSVLASSSASSTKGTAGTTITAGQSLAKAADNTLVLFDANGSAPANVFVGIALNGGATGQPIFYVTADPAFTPGFTVAAGAIVIGSSTAGGLCPAADLATGHYLTIVGVGIGSNKIKMSTLAAGVATP